MDSDVVEEYKLVDETEQMGTSFLLCILTALPVTTLPGLAPPVANPNQELLWYNLYLKIRTSEFQVKHHALLNLQWEPRDKPLIASPFHVSITVQKSNWVEKSKIIFFFFFGLGKRSRK